jgi:type III secretory pathway component EscV
LIKTKNESEILYAVTNNSLGNNLICQYLMMALSLIRGLVLYITLIIVSIVVIYKFKNFLNSRKILLNEGSHHATDEKTKKKAKKESKRETKVTKMVIFFFKMNNKQLVLISHLIKGFVISFELYHW